MPKEVSRDHLGTSDAMQMVHYKFIIINYYYYLVWQLLMNSQNHENEYFEWNEL